MKNIAKRRYGFTLIELIIVIAIIVIIAAAAFVAIDPARRLHAARNSTRWSDVVAVLEAVKKYQADNEGDFPSSGNPVDDSGATFQVIGTDVKTTITCTQATAQGLVLSGAAVTSNVMATGLGTDLRSYLKTLPSDPKTGSGGNSLYYINKDQYGIVTVGACDPEGEDSGGTGTAPVIEATR